MLVTFNLLSEQYKSALAKFHIKSLGKRDNKIRFFVIPYIKGAVGLDMVWYRKGLIKVDQTAQMYVCV